MKMVQIVFLSLVALPLVLATSAFSQPLFSHTPQPLPTPANFCGAQVKSLGQLTPHRTALTFLKALLKEARYQAGPPPAGEPQPIKAVALGMVSANGIVSQWRDIANRLNELVPQLESDLVKGVSLLNDLPGSQGDATKVVVMIDPQQILNHLVASQAISLEGDKEDAALKREPIRLGRKLLLSGTAVGLVLAAIYPTFTQNFMDFFSNTSMSLAAGGVLTGLGMQIKRYFRDVRLASDDTPVEFQGPLRFQEIQQILDKRQNLQSHRVYLGLNAETETGEGNQSRVDTYFTVVFGTPYLVTVEW